MALLQRVWKSEVFDGKKTYLAAGIFFILGLFRLYTGDIQGAVEMFTAALAAAGLRSAIK